MKEYFAISTFQELKYFFYKISDGSDEKGLSVPMRDHGQKFKVVFNFCEATTTYGVLIEARKGGV